MAQVLMEVVLELVRHRDVPQPGATPAETASGAEALATGGIDGALAAVNRLVSAQGFELRRKLSVVHLSALEEIDPLSLQELEDALEGD